jgi:hypothetical protein
MFNPTSRKNMRKLVFLFGTICALALAQLSFGADHKHQGTVTYMPDVTFTLRTDIADGKLVFIGESGAIHDIALPEFEAKSDSITAKGAATAMVFRATRAGQFEYLCTLPGRQARAAGKYKGRKPTPDAIRQEVVRLAGERMTKTAIAGQLNIGEAPVYRILVAASKQRILSLERG